MRFTFREPKIVPPGAYLAELAKVAEDAGKFGPQLRLTFKILSTGDFENEQISMWCMLARDDGTPIDPRPSNKLGRTLAALNNGPIEFGQEVDPSGFVGRRYTIVVEDRGNGKTSITTVTRAAE